MNLSKIAAEFTRLEIRTPRGSTRWYPHAIRRIFLWESRAGPAPRTWEGTHSSVSMMNSCSRCFSSRHSSKARIAWKGGAIFEGSQVPNVAITGFSLSGLRRVVSALPHKLMRLREHIQSKKDCE